MKRGESGGRLEIKQMSAPIFDVEYPQRILPGKEGLRAGLLRAKIIWWSHGIFLLPTLEICLARGQRGRCASSGRDGQCVGSCTLNLLFMERTWAL